MADALPALRARACRRAATLANSLPSVVGLAGCPCVRASIGVIRVALGERRRAPHGAPASTSSSLPRAALQHARVAQIVDVFGGAAEVHQLQRCFGGAGRPQLLAHVVLDSLDIVIDAGLRCCLTASAACTGGSRDQRLGALAHGRLQRCTGELRRGRRQVQQPVRLDADALPDETGLRQNRRAAAAVAAR